MTPFKLPPNELHRLVALCERLASDQLGERAAAALLATAFLKQRNLRWADVLHAEPAAVVVVQSNRGWRDAADDLMTQHNEALTDWEASFLASILSRARTLSEKQAATLVKIADKCGVSKW